MHRTKTLALAFAGCASLVLATLGVTGGAAGASATNLSVCSTVNTTGYAACLTKTTVVNSNWTIVNSSLTVTGSYGWVSSFTFEQKIPARAGLVASSTGSVTDLTEYGTSTESFSATPGSAAPFGLAPSGGYTLINGFSIPAGNIWADNGSYFYEPTTGYSGYQTLGAQIDMVYNHSGQNAGYWFGT